MKNPHKINRFSKEYFLYPEIMKEKENKYNIYQKEQEEINRKKPLLKSSIVQALEKKHFQDINKVLKDQNFDINIIPESSEWIPISYFDNLKYESRLPEEWIQFYKLENGETMNINAKMLQKNAKENQFEWVDAFVKGYENSDNKWILEINQKQIKVDRINFAFGIEDKKIFSQRFIEAYMLREKTNQKIKQHFYISSMPKIDNNLSKNILKDNILAKTNQKTLNQIFQNFKEQYCEIIDSHFQLIQNKIIFDNHSTKQGPKFLKQYELYLLYDKKKKQQNQNGILSLKKNAVRINQKNKKFEYPVTLDFNEKFGLFCLQSIYNENQYTRVLQQVQQINMQIKKLNIFSLQNEETINYNTFKKLQENSTTTFIGQCRASWGKKLIMILEKHYDKFRHLNTQNLETCNDNFQKFQNLLKKIDLVVQDCLEGCIRKSFGEYVKYFEKRTPTQVDIVSIQEVITHYDQHMIKSNEQNDSQNNYKPLFQIVCRISDTQIQILEKPQKFKNLIMVIFQDTLTELSKFRKIEDQIINKNTESRKQKNIKIPQLVQSQKITQHRDNWLFELYNKLGDFVQSQINPIIQYVKQYEQYKDILLIDSQSYLKNYFKTEITDAKEIDNKLNEIKETKKKINEMIPDEIQISCFQLNNQEMKEKVIQEYIRIEKGLTQKIEEIGTQMLNKIIQKNKIIKNKMKKRPESIEQLAEIRDFLQQGLHDQIKETQQEIQAAKKVFDILESNFVKISGDQIRNFWYVYGSCRELIDLKKTIMMELKYQKEAFYDEMKQNQRKFQDEIQFVKQLVLNFINQNDIQKYESIFNESKDIQKQINQQKQKAQYFKEKEELLKKKVTQYNELEEAENQFECFQNFWKTVNTWQITNNCWMFNYWEDIDIQQIKQFFEESLEYIEELQKNVSRNKKHYKKLIIESNNLREKIQNFKKYVPLISSLFNDYIKERHWKEIIEYTQITMSDKDFQNLNLKTLIDKGFIDHQNYCIQVSSKAQKENELALEQQAILESLSTLKIKVENHREYSGYFCFAYLEQNIQELDSLKQKVIEIQKNPYHMFIENELKDLEQKIIQYMQKIKILQEFVSKWSQIKQIQINENLYKKDTEKAQQFREIDQIYLQFSNLVYKDSKIFKLVENQCFANFESYICKLDDLLKWNEDQKSELKQLLNIQIQHQKSNSKILKLQIFLILFKQIIQIE